MIPVTARSCRKTMIEFWLDAFALCSMFASAVMFVRRPLEFFIPFVLIHIYFITFTFHRFLPSTRKRTLCLQKLSTIPHANPRPLLSRTSVQFAPIRPANTKIHRLPCFFLHTTYAGYQILSRRNLSQLL